MTSAKASQDHYETLGVPPNASPAAIKKAYRREVQKYHPDKHEGNELADLAKERLASINEAYGVLGDPQKRREYDGVRVHGGKSTAHYGNRPGSPPRFLRPILWMLGIAGFSILIGYLRNPRVWLIVAIIVGITWALTVRRPPSDD